MHDWTKWRHVYILKYNTCTLNVNISSVSQSDCEPTTQTEWIGVLVA